jgi:hypothetical protein
LEIADPMKAKELNLPELAAEAADGLPVVVEVDAVKVEPEVIMREEVRPAVRPCQSSSSSWGTSKAERRDVMMEKKLTTSSKMKLKSATEVATATKGGW